MPMASRPQYCGVVGIAIHADLTSDRMSPAIGVGAEGFTGSCKDYKSHEGTNNSIRNSRS